MVLGLPNLVMFFFNMNDEVFFTFSFYFSLLNWGGSRLFFVLAFWCVVLHIVSLCLRFVPFFRLLGPLYAGCFSHSLLFLFTLLCVCIHGICLPCIVFCVLRVNFLSCAGIRQVTFSLSFIFVS